MLAVDRLNEGETRYPRSIPNTFYVTYFFEAQVTDGITSLRAKLMLLASEQQCG